MQKILFLLISFFLLAVSLVYAQEDQTSGFVTKTVPVNLGFDNPIQKVSAKFCNQGLHNLQNHGLISLYPNYPSDVCIVLTNTSSGDVAVTMNVVEVGKNNAGEDSCKSSLEVTPFSESILSDTGLQLFTIPAGKSVVRTIPFLVHDNFTGDTRGCVVYTVNDLASQKGMFKVAVYKTNVFDIVIESKTFLNDLKMFLVYHQRSFLISIVIICFLLFAYLSLPRKEQAKHKK